VCVRISTHTGWRGRIENFRPQPSLHKCQISRKASLETPLGLQQVSLPHSGTHHVFSLCTSATGACAHFLITLMSVSPTGDHQLHERVRLSCPPMFSKHLAWSLSHRRQEWRKKNFKVKEKHFPEADLCWECYKWEPCCVRASAKVGRAWRKPRVWGRTRHDLWPHRLSVRPRKVSLEFWEGRDHLFMTIQKSIPKKQCCCSSHLECPPKEHMWKSESPGWHCGGVEPLRGGAS
jgi:hypothetical protein